MAAGPWPQHGAPAPHQPPAGPYPHPRPGGAPSAPPPPMPADPAGPPSGGWAPTGQFPLASPVPPATGGHLTPPHPGGPHPARPVAVLLIGAAGAGKTTVARHWAEHRPVPTAQISLDDVREWVRAGFADPRAGWNENSEAQYRLARRTCGFAARNYLANGISCIVDDAVFPDQPAVGLGGWKRHIGPELLPVVLLPGLEVVLERNARRTGTRRLSDEEVASIHGRMAGWYGSGLPIIDNSRLDVAETAAMLDRIVARSLGAA
nr:AAA family ATPase [Allostreptomyces psammosilenae]